jgi:hypothetical protein
VSLVTVGSLCSKEPEDPPLPQVVVDQKCCTGAQIAADGLRVTGEPSGIFLGVAMSVVFGNDKAYFEVRLERCSGADVLVGLGKRDAEVDKVCRSPAHALAWCGWLTTVRHLSCRKPK